MALSRKTRVPVARETDVARAVVQASRLAKDHQLPENDANKLATAVSELARNIIKYAGSGEVLIGGTTHSSVTAWSMTLGWPITRAAGRTCGHRPAR